jgi:GT2 family glycosyltransferase
MIHTIKTNIVISCWNALPHTKKTISSLFKKTNCPFYLTIVNNASTDGTIQYLKKLKKKGKCKKIFIITNKKNKGAGEAINQGQAMSEKLKVKYTCLCNNDLYFSSKWLEKLENALDLNTNIGILGVLRPAIDVLHHTKIESTKLVVDSTKEGLSINKELSFFQDGFSFEEVAKRIVKVNGGGIEILRCPPNAVITCCALVRNSVSNIIGRFSDKQFKIYGSEDIDLSWRLSKAGYKCAILKDVYVHHFRHRSIKASNLDREKCLLENNLKFIQKWKKEIFAFLKEEEKKGVDIKKMMDEQGSSEYFFLRLMNKKTNFMLEYQNEN